MDLNVSRKDHAFDISLALRGDSPRTARLGARFGRARCRWHQSPGRTLVVLDVVRPFYTKVGAQIQGARCQGKAIRRVRSLAEPIYVRFGAERRHIPVMFVGTCAAAERTPPVCPRGWGSRLFGSLAFGCRVRHNLGRELLGPATGCRPPPVWFCIARTKMSRRSGPGRSLLSLSLSLSQPCSGCRPGDVGAQALSRGGNRGL